MLISTTTKTLLSDPTSILLDTVKYLHKYLEQTNIIWIIFASRSLCLGVCNGISIVLICRECFSGRRTKKRVFLASWQRRVMRGLGGIIMTLHQCIRTATKTNSKCWWIGRRRFKLGGDSLILGLLSDDNGNSSSSYILIRTYLAIGLAP